MKNFTVKIKTSIVSAFLLVLLCVVGAIVTVQYQTNQEFALLTTQKEFESISNKIIGQTQQYDTSSENFITLLKSLKYVNSTVKEGEKHPLLGVITNYIKKANQTYGVYIGYKNDGFYQVINLGVSADIKKLLDTPIKARWLVVKHFVSNGVITRVEESLDRNLNIIKTITKNTQYKPTIRPWYTKALLHNKVIKTDPYIFTSLKKPGVTYASKLSANSQTVIGLDISLQSLSKMLSSKKLVPRSGAYLLKSDGTILGQYDTYLLKKVKNIDEKYKDIFIKNNTMKHLNQQSIIHMGGKDFISFSQKLFGDFDLDQYIVIFSSLDEIMKPHKQKIYDMLKYLLLGVVFIILPLVFLIINFIVKPIGALEQENKKIQNGEFDKVRQIDSFLIEINSLSSSLVDMSASIEENQKNLESQVKERTEDIENLLNNAGQGFLSFDSQMIIGDKYSHEAKRIFNQEIGGSDIMELLYPNDKEKQQFITQTLQGILEDESSKQEILLSLLDKELIINENNIEIEYKILSNESYMLILTDITTQKELAATIEKEQQILKMVVETVTTFEQFLEVKKDYEKFVISIDNFDDLTTLQSLRNSVHTFKGLFAQKEMYSVVQNLHKFETQIDQSLKLNQVVPAVAGMTKEQMIGWLYDDIVILKSILGEEFFNQENKISISISRIKTILTNIEKYVDENKKFRGIYQDIDKLTKEHVKVFVEPYKKLVKELGIRLDKYIEPLEIEYDDLYSDGQMKPFSSQVEEVLNKIDSHTQENDKFEEIYKKIEQLTYHHIKVFIEPYKKVVEQLALKMDKQIEPLYLELDEIYLGGQYKPFLNSLVHIFRNSVDHGIETFDERYESQKAKYAKIKCAVKKQGTNIIISISDDGKGIDIEKIKQQAVDNELYTQEELEEMDENVILMLIFDEGFSTSKEISEISGRGVGLSATYNELKKLGGTLHMNNVSGSGLEFIFTVPYKG